MIYILNNFLPISVAALAAFMAAKIYDDLFNGSGSIKAAGEPGEDTVQAFGFRLGLLAAMFWMASILAGAIIMAPTDEGAGPWVMALGSATIIWMGFVLPAFYVSYRFNGAPTKLMMRDALFWLVIMLGMAAIIRAIGVSAPA